MSNYYSLPIEIDINQLYEVFGNSTETTIRGCTIQEIKKISSILSFLFPVRSILYFQLPPNFVGSIHKDFDLDNPMANPDYAINLPISHCEDTLMYWFKQKEGSVETTLPGPSNGSRTPKLNYEDGICIDTLKCNNPVMVKIDNWHSISNISTTKTSRIISVRFSSQVKKEKVLEFFNSKTLMPG